MFLKKQNFNEKGKRTKPVSEVQGTVVYTESEKKKCDTRIEDTIIETKTLEHVSNRPKFIRKSDNIRFEFQVD